MKKRKVFSIPVSLPTFEQWVFATLETCNECIQDLTARIAALEEMHDFMPIGSDGLIAEIEEEYPRA